MAAARRSADSVEEVALVAHAARGRLLSVHRRLLRWEDLEDCYSQATVELVAQARDGTLRYSGREHLRNTLALRFASRIADRRRALHGRSPAQATLDGALSLNTVGRSEAEIADPRADVERRATLRHDLRCLERAARSLTADQRLLLACQVGLRMGAEEFCGRFGWSHEKHRKVAQRARARLRTLLEESDEGIAGGSVAAARNVTGTQAPVRAARFEAPGEAPRSTGNKIFDGECPVSPGASGERTGTHL